MRLDLGDINVTYRKLRHQVETPLEINAITRAYFNPKVKRYRFDKRSQIVRI